MIDVYIIIKITLAAGSLFLMTVIVVISLIVIKIAFVTVADFFTISVIVVRLARHEITRSAVTDLLTAGIIVVPLIIVKKTPAAVDLFTVPAEKQLAHSAHSLFLSSSNLAAIVGLFLVSFLTVSSWALLLASLS